MDYKWSAFPARPIKRKIQNFNTDDSYIALFQKKIAFLVKIQNFNTDDSYIALFQKKIAFLVEEMTFNFFSLLRGVNVGSRFRFLHERLGFAKNFCLPVVLRL